MRVTILPYVIMLSKAFVMVKGSIVAWVLPPRFFLFSTTQLYSCLYNYNAIVFIS